MRVLKKRPGGKWEAVEVKHDLKSLQEEVGGNLESFTFAEDACVLCDAEGRLKDKPYNTTVMDVSFVGDILIVGVDGENLTDLTPQQEASLRAIGIVRDAE